MAKLGFFFLCDGSAKIPDGVEEYLQADNAWEIHERFIGDAADWSLLPDFTWLVLTEEQMAPLPFAQLKALAALQDKEASKKFILISGSVPPELDHADLAQKLYSLFPSPALVHVDLEGTPDVLSAVVKLLAVRRSPSGAQDPQARIENPDLRSARGNLSIKLVASLYGLSVAALGRLINRSNRAALIKTPDADSLQEALQPFSDVALIRQGRFDDASFRQWLRTPHPGLTRKKPMDRISQGLVQEVASLVANGIGGSAPAD